MATVLLVEDNELNREMLSRRLQRKGFTLLIAVDGLAGVAAAQAHAPDLVLMDMSLPGIDGWEATRRLKADPATRGIPVIALTAHAMSDDRAQALAAGCDEFDTKPVDLDRLLDKMARLLAAPAQGAALPSIAAELTRPAVATQLPAFQEALDRFCAQLAISAALRNDLLVVLDEVCANVFTHAYPAGEPGTLQLRLRRVAPCPACAVGTAAVELVFSDHGQPFDPLAAAAPDLSSAWDERPLGGLGLHLIRQMSDHQAYHRNSADDRLNGQSGQSGQSGHGAAEGNQLTLLKHLA